MTTTHRVATWEHVSPINRYSYLGLVDTGRPPQPVLIWKDRPCYVVSFNRVPKRHPGRGTVTYVHVRMLDTDDQAAHRFTMTEWAACNAKAAPLDYAHPALTRATP